MDYIVFKSVSRIYLSDDGAKTYALNNVSFTLPSHGLIAIVGKSGSGKSTIINLLGKLDKQTDGEIYINKKKINSINSDKYHNKHVGIVFQHYQLLENQTVLFNIMLPSMILGNSFRKSKSKATKLLNSINYPKNLYKNKCQDLSGGEKQRVAILRALIINPPILLCDEPTGALDSDNSLSVMEILKQISKDRLVVMVSHNHELTNKYADRIITIKDGQIEKDVWLHPLDKQNSVIHKEKKIINKHNHWASKISRTNFKKRLARNFISIISLFIGLSASLLIIGFSNGSNDSILINSYRQFDYGVATLSCQYEEEIVGSKMSLVREIRPTFQAIEEYQSTLNKYEIENNFDALVPPSTTLKIGEEVLEDFSYRPIYSFSSPYIDKTLLIKGMLPGGDNLNEVVINQKAYDALSKRGEVDPLKMIIEASFDREFHYYTGEEKSPSISDVFAYDKYFHIVGVVEEMDFLSTPKIYYSYSALIDYLFSYPLNNLSKYLERNISWYERVAIANNSDELSSFSLRLFLKDINKKEEIKDDIDSFNKPIVMESTPYTLSKTLLDLVDAATIGMEIFLVIALIGTSLILGIVSFSSYSEDRKTIAILSSLGAKRDAITSIYVSENMIISIIALSFSFLLSPLLSLGINKLISHLTGFEGMIVIPYLRYFNIPFFLIIGLLFITLFIAAISTALPIAFAGKITLKKELMDE